MKCLLILTLAVLSQASDVSVYQLEDIVDEVPIPRGTRLRIEQIEDPDDKEVWVVGRFPSDRIIVEEGRYGDREKHKELPGKPWIQFFTFLCGHCRTGDLVPVEFWFINPYYAEQYYNDRDSYIEQHNREPKVKVVNFRVTRRPEL